nr:hypothetical protein [Tanacetum cinerariifolium]
MIHEPGDANRDITVIETFHFQTNDELSDKELKQIEADDQAIQTILLGLPEDIYAAVDSCETAQEIWLRERFTSNEGESIESYYHCFLKLMNDLKRNKHFPEKIASNLKFLNNLQPKWSRHVTIVHQTKDLHTADYTQLYDLLEYNQKEVDELKAERIAKTQDPLALMANSNNPYVFPNYLQQPMPNPEDITDPTNAMNMVIQNAVQNPRVQNVGNQNGLIGVQRNGNQNQIRNGNLVAARAERNAAGQNGNQIRCYNCREVGHYARNCIVRPKRRDAAYLQTQLLIAQKEEAGIQLQAEDAPVYDTGGSTEVHKNCDDNEIFNMFTQEEQYTELLKHIPESHQVPHNDNDVISEDTSVEQEGDILLLEAFLNDDHSSDFKTKSSSTSLNSLLEETNTFDNYLPKSDIPCFDVEEISSGSTTTHSDIYLPEYEASYDDQSFSDEDHPDNAESDLMQSLRTHDSSLLISSKIDSLLGEFAGKLTLLKSIPLGIDETNCDFEEDIRLIERLLYDNSFPRPPKEFVFANSDAEIESFSPSPILIKDSDSLMEEIDLSCTPDYPMPPRIEDDEYNSERDIFILKDLPSNNTLSFAEKESFHFDIPSFCRPPAKPLDGNTGILKMMGDIFDQKSFMHKLMITLASH